MLGYKDIHNRCRSSRLRGFGGLHRDRRTVRVREFPKLPAPRGPRVPQPATRRRRVRVVRHAQILLDCAYAIADVARTIVGALLDDERRSQRVWKTGRGWGVDAGASRVGGVHADICNANRLAPAPPHAHDGSLACLQKRPMMSVEPAVVGARLRVWQDGVPIAGVGPTAPDVHLVFGIVVSRPRWRRDEESTGSLPVCDGLLEPQPS